MNLQPIQIWTILLVGLLIAVVLTLIRIGVPQDELFYKTPRKVTEIVPAENDPMVAITGDFSMSWKNSNGEIKKADVKTIYVRKSIVDSATDKEGKIDFYNLMRPYGRATED